MKYIGIVIVILIFLAFLYMGLKAYTKINFGKSKEEMNIVNNYIYGSITYMALITIFIAIILYNFF